jgi:hypothetical protein
VKRKSELTIAIARTVLAVPGRAAVCVQDRYSLKSPSGIVLSDSRGYEDWAVVSFARTDEGERADDSDSAHWVVPVNRCSGSCAAQSSVWRLITASNECPSQ